MIVPNSLKGRTELIAVKSSNVPCGNFAIDIVYVLTSYLGPIDCVRVCCLCCAIPDSCCGYLGCDLLNSVYLVVVCAHVGIES